MWLCLPLLGSQIFTSRLLHCVTNRAKGYSVGGLIWCQSHLSQSTSGNGNPFQSSPFLPVSVCFGRVSFFWEKEFSVGDWGLIWCRRQRLSQSATVSSQKWAVVAFPFSQLFLMPSQASNLRQALVRSKLKRVFKIEGTDIFIIMHISDMMSLVTVTVLRKRSCTPRGFSLRRLNHHQWLKLLKSTSTLRLR